MPIEKESWLTRNATSLAAFILSLLIILGGFLIGYGKIQSDLASIRAENLKTQAQFVDLDIRVRAHHEDISRHIDPDKWKMICDQLTEIRVLVLQHMQSQRGAIREGNR